MTLPIAGRRALLAAPFLAPLTARAQTAEWPTRSITIVEGYPPGGVTDTSSRLVAERMTRELGQAVLVENRPGAATSVATTSVVRSRPDGYTLGMGTTTLAINPAFQPTLTPREPQRELVPVGMVFRTPFILHVHPSVPATNLAELIAYAKSKPGEITWASSGTGAVNHLAIELFKRQAGIEVLHVPYRGGVPGALDLAQGRVQAMFSAVLEAVPHLSTGATRGIAVTLGQRLPNFPNLPPISDTLPGYEVTFWQGLFAPAGTPEPILAKAGRALGAATSDPDLRARLAEQGVELVTGDANQLRATLASETQRWGDLIRQANIKPE